MMLDCLAEDLWTSRKSLTAIEQLVWLGRELISTGLKVSGNEFCRVMRASSCYLVRMEFLISHGLGPLHRIRSNMDCFVYEQILQNVMLPFARGSLRTAWAQIPQSVLTNLPRRCQAVIDSQGFAD
uniref:Uncharacterized protein n=1 Tax=Caenorhabditis japonica TaxID=281687 RepID=A0A8R1I7A8_CAEJA